ncbi:MAG: sporulation protein [Oscillospiraceae bacterium]|nr:sporulation protein [Oscillospiraceae bacterium]
MAGEEHGVRTQNLILEDRKRLSVSGVEEVAGFDDTFVRARTVLGDLLVRGEGLHVETLSVDDGELVITGTISDLEYEEKTVRGGRLSRLFG